MAYPSSFLTITAATRVRLRYTGGTEATNLNTKFDAVVNLLNGTTTKDIKVDGSIAGKGFYPYSDAGYSLGDATYGFTAAYLDNGATDGGSVYFDGAATSYIKSAADGATLTVGGFTAIDFAAATTVDFNAAAVSGITTFGTTGRLDSGSILAAVDATDGYLMIRDGIVAPGATANGAKIYVDTADGDLKVVFADGTVKTLATD